MIEAPTPKRWLVAHDFSEAARAAADEVADEVVATGGVLILLHVRGVPPVPVGLEWMGGNAMTPVWSDLQASWTDRAERALADEARRLAEAHPGLAVQVEVVEGRPAEAILHAADDLDAARLVIGSHGHSKLRNAMMGSTADKVVRLAKVPVLVVKGGHHHGPDEGGHAS